MRLLACGGRDYSDVARVNDTLDAIHAKTPVTLLINGGARGADELAHMWATTRNIDTRVFKADWKTHGKVAGPIRNQQMIESKPDLVVAFPGGRGTLDMMLRADSAGIPVQRIAQ